MQGALQTSAIITIEFTNPLNDKIQIVMIDLFGRQGDFLIDKAGRRVSAQVKNDLEQVIAVIRICYRL
jgi:hypothetical protein